MCKLSYCQKTKNLINTIRFRGLNKSGNVIVLSVFISIVLVSIVLNAWLFIYNLYGQIIDLKDQMQISIHADSFANKKLIDYINNPLMFILKDSASLSQQGFTINNSTRYVNYFTDEIVPWHESAFMLTSFDNESLASLNKIVSLKIFYNKWNQKSDISIGFIRYNEDTMNDLRSGNQKIPYDSPYCSDSNTLWAKNEYKCMYEINDFWGKMKNNINDYLLFLNSKQFLSFSLEWFDENGKQIQIPSRYLNLDFNTSTKKQTVTKKTQKQIDIYAKYKLNFNSSLYYNK